MTDQQTTETVEHTPTPWVAGSGEGRIYIESADHDRICSWPFRDGYCPTFQANLAFIVRACNSHDTLAVALRAALYWLEHPATHDAFREDPKLYTTMNQNIEAARAALAEATKGE